MKRCRWRRIKPHPRNLSSGHKSGPGISFCGCGPGRQSVSRASSVNRVGVAPAHDRAGKTREMCGAATSIKSRVSLSFFRNTRFVANIFDRTLLLRFVLRALTGSRRWSWHARRSRPVGTGSGWWHHAKRTAVRMVLHVRHIGAWRMSCHRTGLWVKRRCRHQAGAWRRMRHTGWWSDAKIVVLMRMSNVCWSLILLFDICKTEI